MSATTTTITTATIQASTPEFHHPITPCPAWCPMPAGTTHLLGDWTRFHKAWSGTMTYQDCLRTVTEIVVEVSQFEYGEGGD